jgi:hypothetical protein
VLILWIDIQNLTQNTVAIHCTVFYALSLAL